jgi:hypothetical protein
MAKARKQAIDPADALQARAAEDPELAAILDALVRRLLLWRLCGRIDCKRARECRGGAATCRAWCAHRPVPRRADTQGDQAGARKIVFQWRDPKDAKT